MQVRGSSYSTLTLAFHANSLHASVALDSSWTKSSVSVSLTISHANDWQEANGAVTNGAAANGAAANGAATEGTATDGAAANGAAANGAVRTAPRIHATVLCLSATIRPR